MTGKVEQRIKELGITLPQPIQVPPGINIPLVLIKTFGTRVMVAGHGPLEKDGSISQPLGRVGEDVTLEQAIEAAQKVALAMVDTIQREVGDLDRVKHFVKVLGMVNSAPDFTGQTPVINGFSEQIIEIFGEECGKAPRSAVGMSQLPFGIPVEIEAELELYD